MNKELSKAYFALGLVCIVWGTTYFFMHVGVTTIPPFLFSGIRQIAAGLTLFVLFKSMGKWSKITRKNLLRQSIPGILMIALGNGMIGWTQQFIPSGLAALIASTTPMNVVLISYITGAEHKKPNEKIIAGLLLGTIGIFLIFKDNILDFANPGYFAGMLIAFLATLSWASGTVLIKYRPPGTNAMTSATIQMLSAGVFLLVMSLLSEDYSSLSRVSAESIWSLLYLIVVGSIITYPCFVFALEKLPVGLSSIYAYINPFIALLLGYLFLEEKLTWTTAMALLSALGGIYFINNGYQAEKKLSTNGTT